MPVRPRRRRRDASTTRATARGFDRAASRRCGGCCPSAGTCVADSRWRRGSKRRRSPQLDRGLGGAAEVIDDAGQLAPVQRARFRGLGEFTFAIGIDQEGLGPGADRRRCDGLAAVGLEGNVRDAADMPQLHDDLAAGLVNRVGHPLPSSQGVLAPEPGHFRIVAGGRPLDHRAFGDDQADACRGPTPVVGRHIVPRHAARRMRAGHGRNDDAMGQIDGLQPE